MSRHQITVDSLVNFDARLILSSCNGVNVSKRLWVVVTLSSIPTVRFETWDGMQNKTLIATPSLADAVNAYNAL